MDCCVELFLLLAVAHSTSVLAAPTPQEPVDIRGYPLDFNDGPQFLHPGFRPGDRRTLGGGRGRDGQIGGGSFAGVPTVGARVPVKVVPAPLGGFSNGGSGGSAPLYTSIIGLPGLDNQNRLFGSHGVIIPPNGGAVGAGPGIPSHVAGGGTTGTVKPLPAPDGEGGANTPLGGGLLGKLLKGFGSSKGGPLSRIMGKLNGGASVPKWGLHLGSVMLESLGTLIKGTQAVLSSQLKTAPAGGG